MRDESIHGPEDGLVVRVQEMPLLRRSLVSEYTRLLL